MSDAYCDLCDLPLSTCVHGMPAPPPVEVKPAPRTKTPPRVPGTRASAPAAAVDAKPVKADISVRRADAKRTPQRYYRHYILEALVEAGGKGSTDDVLADVERLMEDVLLDGDRDKMPTGELRWRNAARFERKAMLDEGLLLPVTQPGVWELSPEGRSLATD